MKRGLRAGFTATSETRSFRVYPVRLSSGKTTSSGLFRAGPLQGFQVPVEVRPDIAEPRAPSGPDGLSYAEISTIRRPSKTPGVSGGDPRRARGGFHLANPPGIRYKIGDKDETRRSLPPRYLFRQEDRAGSFSSAATSRNISSSRTATSSRSRPTRPRNGWARSCSGWRRSRATTTPGWTISSSRSTNIGEVLKSKGLISERTWRRPWSTSSGRRP